MSESREPEPTAEREEEAPAQAADGEGQQSVDAPTGQAQPALDGRGEAGDDLDEDDEGDPSQDRWAEPERRLLLKKALESLVFVSDRIVTHAQLARIVNARSGLVRTLLREVVAETAERGVQLVEVSGGYQYRTSPDTGMFVRELVSQKPVRLSRAQLETLALVAYRQPITRPEIDEVRGVDTGSALKVLLDRGLIKMIGRKDEAGRPLLYGTTPYFLEFFGLGGLRDLPTLKEFTELSDDSRTLFKRKTGETVEQAQSELAQLGGDMDADIERQEEPEVESAGDSAADGEFAANHNGEPESGAEAEAQSAEVQEQRSKGAEEVDLDRLDVDHSEDDFK